MLPCFVATFLKFDQSVLKDGQQLLQERKFDPAKSLDALDCSDVTEWLRIGNGHCPGALWVLSKQLIIHEGLTRAVLESAEVSTEGERRRARHDQQRFVHGLITHTVATSKTLLLLPAP